MVESEGRPRLCGECVVFKTRLCRRAYAGQDLILCTDSADGCEVFHPLKNRYMRYLRDLKKLRAWAEAHQEGRTDLGTWAKIHGWDGHE